MLFEAKVRKELEKSGYRFVGKHGHSANKICTWTKNSLRGKGVCYKERWYGIKSHKCVQCTVSMLCNTRCRYCWRTFKAFTKPPEKFDDPEVIFDGLVEAQRKLLSGFGGNEIADKRKWKEAQNPTNFALSLVGESLFYPKFDDLVKLIHKKGGSTFLVTKGTLPERLESLEEEPTNLYISLCAPDEETFKNLDRPLQKDAWKKHLKSLEIMRSFSNNTVLRMTSVKGWNMKHPEKYAKLIEMASPNHIEVKAYMHVGFSQKRLKRENMPLMSDMVEWAKEVANHSGYVYKDEFEPSRVILLSKK
jgi:tRNA wybutosine-synthesizing protein 1